MLFFSAKIFLTLIIVITIFSLPQFYNLRKAILATIPLIISLAVIWLYLDGSYERQLIGLSYEVFWLLLPVLIFSIPLPFILKKSYPSTKPVMIIFVILIVIYLLISITLKASWG